MPPHVAWLLTFLFVNITWVFFRAKDGGQARRILRGMTDLHSAFSLPIDRISSDKLAWGGVLSDRLLAFLPHGFAANLLCFVALAIGFVILRMRNSYQLMMDGEFGPGHMTAALLLFTVAFYATLMSTSTVFLYFNF